MSSRCVRRSGRTRVQLVRLVLIDGGLMAAAAGAAALWLAALFKDQAASLIAFYGQPVASRSRSIAASSCRRIPVSRWQRW